MIKLSVSSFISTLKEIIFSSPSSILFIIIGLLFIISMIIDIKKNKKINKKLFLIGWIFISLYIIIRYNSHLTILSDNLVNNIFMQIFFPNLSTYIIIIILTNIIFLVNINKDKKNIEKITDTIFYSTIMFIMIYTLEEIIGQKINVYSENIYTNQKLLVLIETTTIAFTLWMIIKFSKYILNKMIEINNKKINEKFEKINPDEKIIKKTIKLNNEKPIIEKQAVQNEIPNIIEEKEIQNKIPNIIEKKVVENKIPNTIEEKEIQNEIPNTIEKQVVENKIPNTIEEKEIQNEIPNTIEKQVVENEIQNTIEKQAVQNETPNIIEKQVIQNKIQDSKTKDTPVNEPISNPVFLNVKENQEKSQTNKEEKNIEYVEDEYSDIEILEL